DIRAGELRKRGIKLRLQGQPLQILGTLLNRAGEVVTREELRGEIWTADTFVDFDHSLHNAIARLREVLGDSADTPRYIETLPRRGYRFIAPVKRIEAEPQLPVSENGQADGAPNGVRPTRVRAAVGVCAAGVSCGGVDPVAGADRYLQRKCGRSRAIHRGAAT
ncbi:MAG: winged helix-turn-helix domain-containing protein, partial [Candidatus Acidiferrum sp.]